MDRAAHEQKAANDEKSGLKRLAPILVIGLALAAFFAFGLHKYFTLETLRENRAALQDWVDVSPVRAIAVFVAVYAAAVAISFPGASILTIFGGYLFGLAIGVPSTVFAATLGATAIFLAAKTALGDFLHRRAGGFIRKMEQGFHEDELNYMFVLRLIPAFPFWAINIAAGVLGVSTRNFIIGTGLGIIPGSFVYTSIGAAAGAAFDAGEDVTLSGILLQPQTLLPIVGLIFLALLPIILKKVNRQAATLDNSSLSDPSE